MVASEYTERLRHGVVRQIQQQTENNHKNDFLWLFGRCLLPAVFLSHRLLDCTLPISTILASAEAGELGLTGGSCFVTSRFKLPAVAVLLFFKDLAAVCFYCAGIRLFSVLLRTHTTYCMYQTALPFFTSQLLIF